MTIKATALTDGRPLTAEMVLDLHERRATRARSRGIRVEPLSKEQAEKMAAAHNHRYEIVAVDNGRPIIREEMDELTVRRLSPSARLIATMMLRETEAVRSEIVKAFDKDGKLIYPWPLK